jgi:plastocyanin
MRMARIPAFVAARLRAAGYVVSCAAAVWAAAPAGAQETLERAPGTPGGWVGYTGLLYANVPFRFSTIDGEVVSLPTFELGMGLPRSLVGVRFAPGSATVPGHPTEWEPFGRIARQVDVGGAAVDVAVGAAFNGAARSVDGEASVARWFGPLRLIGEGRALSRAFGDRTRGALAGGAVLHPLEGRAPLALTGSVGTLLGRSPGENVAWSAGAQLGASFTDHTLSVFATNTPSSTLQGLSRGDGTLRIGVEMTIPVPAGRFLGWYLPREIAREAVDGDADGEPAVVAAIARYLFAPKEIEIRAGSTVEWVNADAVVHTVAADDGTWDSRAVQPGERWRATFTRPGRYPYHCGPHPFMKGVIVVR